LLYFARLVCEFMSRYSGPSFFFLLKPVRSLLSWFTWTKTLLLLWTTSVQSD
jgi:hypothetical protein